MKNDFAKTLKAARKEAGLTQAQLADAAGLSKPTIAKYESGERVPEYQTADDIACALNATGETRDALMAAARPPKTTTSVEDRLAALEAEVKKLDVVRDEVQRLVQSNRDLVASLTRLAQSTGVDPKTVLPSARSGRRAAL